MNHSSNFHCVSHSLTIDIPLAKLRMLLLNENPSLRIETRWHFLWHKSSFVHLLKQFFRLCTSDHRHSQLISSFIEIDMIAGRKKNQCTCLLCVSSLQHLPNICEQFRTESFNPSLLVCSRFLRLCNQKGENQTKEII